MRFGKIDYINLLPFYVFTKRHAHDSRFNAYIRNKKSYPSQINRLYKRRKVDAAFISSVYARNEHGMQVGIVARGAVWSVIALSDRESKEDFESSTSNVLAALLGVEGEILIGDKALRAYLEREGRNLVDLAELWHQKTGLPFVFARLCSHTYHKRYEAFARKFAGMKIYIPHYILQKYVQKTGIAAKDIKRYLKRIDYVIDKKAQKGLKKFYSDTRALGRKKHQ